MTVVAIAVLVSCLHRYFFDTGAVETYVYIESAIYLDSLCFLVIVQISQHRPCYADARDIWGREVVCMVL